MGDLELKGLPDGTAEMVYNGVKMRVKLLDHQFGLSGDDTIVEARWAIIDVLEPPEAKAAFVSEPAQSVNEFYWDFLRGR